MALILRSIGHPTKVFVPQISSLLYLSQINISTQIGEVNEFELSSVFPLLLAKGKKQQRFYEN